MPATSVPSRWRTSLPATLCLFAVVLSSSTACLTSALISSAEQSARNRELAAAETQRQKITQALRPLLPAKTADNQFHFAVTGGPKEFTVMVVGELSPEAMSAFETAARRVLEDLPKAARITVEYWQEDRHGMRSRSTTTVITSP